MKQQGLLLTLLVAVLLLPLTVMAHDSMYECRYSPQETAFQLYAAPEAAQVTLRLYRDGVGGRACRTVAMTRQQSDVAEVSLWRTVVKGDWKGYFYTFSTSTGRRHLETPGIFATAVGVNGKRAAIVDIASQMPQGWDDERPLTLVSPADLVVYELHFRDFSIARSDARYKGKFLALTEPWAIRHLQSLGVNAVHILPSFDFASVDESRPDIPQYNWGYDPLNYNVPEGSYSTDPGDPCCRISEFARMVEALHKAGIRVILDVVYNHTFDISGSAFQRTIPYYFYRGQWQDKSGSRRTFKPSDGSGCGNETASERQLMRRFMVSSVLHWARTYHIDGFRFDLMAVHDIETMNLIRKELHAVNPNIFIYGEGWSAGQCALPAERLASKANVAQMPGIAAFSDELRDALRGPFSDDSKGGWLAGVAGQEESLKYGIVGCISHPQVDMSLVNYSKSAWAAEPTQMMSYVSCHDDMCLVDRLKASVTGLSSALDSPQSAATRQLIRLALLAQTAVFTSQGVPFMLSGEELLRTKQGVHNSYKSPDSINQLDWSALKRYPEVFQYYRSLIALRRHHPAFRLGDAHLVRKHLEFLSAPDGVVAFRLKGHAGRDEWRDIIVVLNASRREQQVSIPRGLYSVVCADGIIDERGLSTINGSQATVSPQSALILHN